MMMTMINRFKHLLNVTKEHIKQIQKKCKARHITGHEGPEGEQSYSFIPSVTSALDDDGWSTLGMGPFTSGKETGSDRIGDWVDPGASLHGCGNRYTRLSTQLVSVLCNWVTVSLRDRQERNYVSFSQIHHSIIQLFRNSNTLMLTSGHNLVIQSCEENDTKRFKKSYHTVGAVFCSVQMNIKCNV